MPSLTVFDVLAFAGNGETSLRLSFVEVGEIQRRQYSHEVSSGSVVVLFEHRLSFLVVSGPCQRSRLFFLLATLDLT